MDILDQMTASLFQTASEIYSYEPARPPFCDTPDHLRLIKSFFFPWDKSNRILSEASFNFYRQVNGDRQHILNDERILRCCNTLTQPLDASAEIFISSNLESILDTLHQRLQTSVLQARTEIQEFLKSKLNSPYGNMEIWSSSIGVDLTTAYHQNQENFSLLLFAVPGSGKTRSLRRLLSHHYGLYFQSCSVEPTSNGIHGPSRRPGSKDSNSLLKFLEHADSHSGVMPRLISFWITGCFKTLLKWRIHMLQQFVNFVGHLSTLAHHNPNFFPKIWFDLQTSDQLDLFDQVFQLLCMLPTSFNPRHVAHSRRIWEFSVDSLQSTQIPALFICLDEAQADLGIQMQHNMASTGPENLFEHWIFAFRQVREDHQKSASKPSPTIIRTIYAGTSLEIQKVNESLQSRSSHYYAFLETSASNDPFEPVRKWSRFPLIENDSQFRALLIDQGTLTIIEENFSTISNDLCGIIVRSGIALWGRPRWSSLYAQAVNEVLRSNVPIDISILSARIQTAAKNVYIQIIQDLRERLQLLINDTSRRKVVLSLCEVVTKCYLWDRPIAFAEEDVPDMVADAFAVMKTIEGVESYYLAEKTAVDAAWTVFSHSINGSPSMVDEELNKFLGHHQHDNRLFGKAAEVYLAWVSCFR